MTPRGPDDIETDETPSGDLPEPPYPAETIADFHAGVLSPRLTAHIGRRIADDPSAQEMLRALDRTRDDLAAAPLMMYPVPDSVRGDVTAALAALSAGSTPHDPPPAHAETTVDDLAARRRARRPVLGVLLAAAAVAVVAIGAFGIFGALTPADDTPTPSQAQPTAASEPEPATFASALSVLGKDDGAPFGSTAALRDCLSAHAVPPEVAIVGSGEILVDDAPAAAILLSTGVAGRFDALVVGLDCDADTPSLIGRRVIGAG